MAFKIYAEVLRKRLEEEVKKMELLPKSQGGFGSRRETLENIFVLNHVVQRERKKEEGKVYTMFVDFMWMAAFDIQTGRNYEIV